MNAAIKKRTAAPRNGGMLSSPILIANHVDPQRMQIRMYPRTIFVDSDFRILFLLMTLQVEAILPSHHHPHRWSPPDP